MISAYVGSDPLEYVADPAGIEIYCSNNPVGTDPDGVEDLLSHGASVWFVPRLHAKVYWSENHGALIGSANLSTNAFGDLGLFEALFRTEDIDIDDVLKRMRKHAPFIEVTPAILEQFRRQHRKAHGQFTKPVVRKAKGTPTFEDWLGNEYRKPFSVITWYSNDATDLTSGERSSVEEFHETHETGLTGHKDMVTLWGPVAKFPIDEDVLLVKQTSRGQISLSGTTWLRFELKIETRTGRGGKGRRTRLVQVRPRTSQIPFQPGGLVLKQTLTAFYAAHPIGENQATIFSLGSRKMRWLIEAASI